MGSMGPVVVIKDGEPIAATGTLGSVFIPSLVLNVVLNVIDHRIPLQQAVHASRIWLTNTDGNFSWNYAAGWPAAPQGPSFDQTCPPLPSNDCHGVIQELRAMGHIVARRPTAAAAVFGSLASIAVDQASFDLVAAADDIRQRDAKAAVVSR